MTVKTDELSAKPPAQNTRAASVQRTRDQYEKQTKSMGRISYRKLRYSTLRRNRQREEQRMREHRSPIALTKERLAKFGRERAFSSFAVAAVLSMSVADDSLCASTFQDGITKWLVDSGSGVTCTPHVEHFHTYKTFPTPHTVTDAGGGKHDIVASGSVRLRVSTDAGWQVIIIENVLHIPSFVLPILSTKRMRQQGYDVHLPNAAPGRITLPSKDDIPLTEGHDGLEFLQGYIAPESDKTPIARVHALRYKDVSAWAAASDPVDLIDRLAHPLATDNVHTRTLIRRALARSAIYTPEPANASRDAFLRLHNALGHPNSKLCTEFARKYLGESEFIALGKTAVDYCRACRHTKAIHKTIPKISKELSKPDKPWSVMSMDVVDFKATSVTHKYRYAVVFVDHYTHANRVYGAVNITRLNDIVDNHLQWVKIGFPESYEICTITHELTPDTVTVIKSDGARYWSSPAMKIVYAKHHIAHIMSSPHRQERNGKCERMIRTLKSSANAMRSASSLGPSFWWLALEHASHTTQLLNTSANPGNISPYEMLTGKQPSHRHLHIFGATAFVTRESDKIRANEFRAEAGMYCGWDVQRRAHKVLLPPSTLGTGPVELRHLRSQQPGSLPQRKVLQMITVAPENIRITPGIPEVNKTDDSVHGDSYESFDANDDDDMLIIGNQAVEIPLQDRSTPSTHGEGTLDLDYHATHYASVDYDHHATHCTTAPNNCRCLGWSTTKVDGEFTLHRVAVVLPSTSAALRAAHIKLPKQSTGYQGGENPKPGKGWETHEYDKIARLTHFPLVAAIGVCNTWKDAQASEHVHHYIAARKSERDKLLHPTKGVMRPIPISKIPSGQRLLPSSMRFVLKLNEKNEIIKGKARWVAGGHRMRPGVDYDESHADCPHWTSVRLFFANAAKLGRTVRTGDIESAYTQGPPQRTIYLRAPSGQKEFDPSTNEEIVYECFGNLYGKKDAGNVWGKHLSDWLTKDQGYTQSTSEPCLYTRKKGTLINVPPPTIHGTSPSGGASTASDAANPDTPSNESPTITSGGAAAIAALEDSQLLVYVDDLAYHSTTTEGSQQLEQAIVAKFGDIGAQVPNMYLGANIVQDETGTHLCHKSMIERLGKTFFPDLAPSMYNLSGAQTPFPSNGSALGDSVSLSDCPDTAGGEPPLNAPYRELLGSLGYIATTTRPDIAWYTSQLARVQSSPGETHFKLAKRVLKYLLRTPDFGLKYHRNGLGLHYYVDSSWADIEPHYVKDKSGVPRTIPGDDGRRSSFGFVGYYASGPISWASRIHKGTRTLSTCEAELVAATEACKDLLHIRYVAKDLEIDTSQRTPLFEDNQSTISLILKSGITKRSKHVETRWFFCRELQDAGLIQTIYKHTSEQVADIMTKRLTEETFKYLRDRLVVPQHSIQGPILDLGKGTATVM